MKRKVSLAALALVVGSAVAVAFAFTASAQSAPSYMTVDAVNVDSYGLLVWGVREGEAVVSASRIGVSSNPSAWELARFKACHRSLLLALSRPGQYVLRFSGACNVALVAP